MSIRAVLTDGTVLEFPDGTDPQVISAKAKSITLTRMAQKATGSSDPAVINAYATAHGATTPTHDQMAARFPEEARESKGMQEAQDQYDAQQASRAAVARSDEYYTNQINARGDPLKQGGDIIADSLNSHPQADPAVQTFGRTGSFAKGSVVQDAVEDPIATKPRDDFPTFWTKTAHQIGDTVESQIGALTQWAYERSLKSQGEEGGVDPREVERAINEARLAGSIPGQQLRMAAMKDLAANQYASDNPGYVNYTGKIYTGVMSMLPALAASAATENPYVGAALIGAGAGGEKYADTRYLGSSINAATGHGLFSAAANSLPAMVPLGFYMKEGGAFLPETMKAAGLQGTASAMTTTLQIGYDTGVLNEKMTWGEAVRKIEESGIDGAVMGAAIKGTEHPFDRMISTKYAAQIEAARQGFADDMAKHAAVIQSFDPNGYNPADLSKSMGMDSPLSPQRPPAKSPGLTVGGWTPNADGSLSATATARGTSAADRLRAAGVARSQEFLKPGEESSPIAGLANEGFGSIDKDAGDIFGRETERSQSILNDAVENARRIAQDTPQVSSAPDDVQEAPRVPVPPQRASAPHLQPELVNGLQARGFTPAQARGIAAGIHAESGSDPNIVNKTSGALGLGQWLGSRKAELISRYGDHPTMDQQLDFLAWELRGGDGGGKKVLGHNDDASVLQSYITDFMRPAKGGETSGDMQRGFAALGRGVPPGARSLASAMPEELASHFPDAHSIELPADHSFTSLRDEDNPDTVLHGVVDGTGDFHALQDFMVSHAPDPMARDTVNEITQLQTSAHATFPGVTEPEERPSVEPSSAPTAPPGFHMDGLSAAQPLRPTSLSLSMPEPGNGQLGKGVISPAAHEVQPLDLTQKMPERPASRLDDVPAAALAQAYHALDHAIPRADGRFLLPSGTTGEAVRALMTAGVDISPRDLTVAGPDIRTIQQHGLEEFARTAPDRLPEVIDRGPEALPHQRYMRDHGDGSFGLGATPDAARADTARSTRPQAGEESFAQRSDPGAGKWISSLYEGVRGLSVKNATVSEWLNHIYDEGGNRMKLPGVKVDELKETGMLATLKQIGSDSTQRVSKEDFLSMVDGLLPHIAEHVLDDSGPALSGNSSRTLYKGYTVDGYSSNGYEEHVLRLPQGVGGNPYGEWNAGHFGERGDDINSNPVVHFRTSMKEAPDGKKVLFVEEMQSDLHSDASKRAKAIENTTGAKVSGYREPVTEEFSAQHAKNVEGVKQAKQHEIDATIDFMLKRSHAMHEDGQEHMAKTVREWAERADNAEFQSRSDAISSLRAAVSALGLDVSEEVAHARDEYGSASRAARRTSAIISEANNPMAPVRAPWAKPEAHTRLAMRRIIQLAAEKGAERVVWVHGDQQNGGRVSGDANGDWYYGERNMEGRYTDKEGNLRPAIVPNTVEKLIKPMGGSVRHDIGVKLESAQLPPHLRGLAEQHDIPASEYEYMSADDLRTTLNSLDKDIADANGSRDNDWFVKGLEEKRAIIEHALADKEGRNAFSGFDITPQMRAEAKRGMPLFRTGEGAQDHGPMSFDERMSLSKGIREELEKRGVDKGVYVHIDNWLSGAPGDRGRYTPATRLLEIAHMTSDDPYHTARHELIHHLRTIDVVTKQEWLALQQRAARAERSPGQTYLQWAEDLYRGDPRSTQVEEAVAEMSADFITKRADMGKVEKIIARIGDVIASMGDAWRKLTGAEPSGGKVLRDIESGKVGSRDDGTGDMGDRSAFDVMDSLAARRTFTPSMYEDPANPSRGNARQIVDMFRGLGSLMRGQRGDQARASARKFAETWVDNMVGWKHFEEKLATHLGSVPESASVYLKNELMKSRAAAKIEKVAEMMEHIVNDLKQNDLDFQTIGQFLALRHAPHRDAKVEAKNPYFRGRAPDEPGGSGYSQVEQQQMEADLRATGKWAEMEQIADKVDALNQHITMEKVSGGLLSQEQADAGFGPKEHYVPLKGHDEIDEQDDGSMMGGSGRGVMVRGRESKLMAGREANAPEEDILPHVFAQAQAALIRVEKNRVAQALGELHDLAPDPALWKKNQVVRRPYLLKGEIKYRYDANLTPEELARSVGYKINGDQHYVTFNDQSDIGMRLANEIRNMNAPEFNGFMQLWGRASHAFKALRTQYNPTFFFRNMFRDLQEGVFNLMGTELKDKKMAVWKDGVIGGAAWREAMAATFRGHGSGSAYGQAWNEYTASGGPTHFARHDPVEEVKAQIKHRLNPGWWDRTASTTAWAFSPLSKANEGQENALRFSAFYHARQEGLSIDKAASIAKNITVNFERHGNSGPVLNLLYAFANPNIQGNARLLQTISKSPARALRAATAMTFVGAALQLWNQYISDKDSDGVTYWDKMKDFQKEANWIIMTPGSKVPAITIPKPWGIGVFPNMGAAIVDMLTGKKSVAAASGSTVLTVMNAFNPVGGNRFWNTVAPTMLDPVVDINIYNAEFSGKKIKPDQLSQRKDQQVPESQLSWDNTPFAYKAAMRFLARATGGDEVKPGAVEVSPEIAHYWVKFMVGTAGEEAERMFTTPSHWLSGKEVTLNDIPMLRALGASKTSDRERNGEARQHISEASAFYSTVKKYAAQGYTEEADREIKANPELVAFYDKATYAQKAFSIYSAADRAIARASMNKGSTIDEKGIKAIGALYGMKPKEAVASIPNNPTPDQLKAVKELVEREKADLITQLNKSWQEEVVQARKKRTGG